MKRFGYIILTVCLAVTWFLPACSNEEATSKTPVYTHHGATAAFKINKSGALYATSLCNIHGLWENAKVITVK